MKIVVKLGGTLLDEHESRQRLAHELADVRDAGIDLAVVHGGGKQMTRFLAERGVESTFVEGLRVSTPDVIDAVLKVLAGSVNHQLVASLVAAGAPAVGLSGIDAGLTQAEPMRADLGAVGRVVHCEARLLDVLLAGGYLPVIACVAGDQSGNIYNVNADQMAVACATGFAADRLVFLTDVAGVRGRNSETLQVLTPSACETLIQDKVATGGMQAKLTAAIAALQGGITEVVIAPGERPGTMKDLLAGAAIGTRLIAEEVNE